MEAGTFEAYRAHLTEAWPAYQAERSTRARLAILAGYGAHLPQVLTSWCPVCGTPWIERVDTHSLNGFLWRDPCDGAPQDAALGLDGPRSSGCAHRRCVVYFLSLEGRTPDDLFPDKVIRTGPEVPSVMREVMASGEAMAVLHRLPIARFDTGEPGYAVYVLAYYTASVGGWASGVARGLHHGSVEYGDVDHDLEAWARQGRLRWLRRVGAGVALAGWGDEPFPYGGLTGERAASRVITARGAVVEREPLVSKGVRWVSRWW